MSKRIEKTNSIIQAVLTLLAEEGTEKLSMRKVAEKLDMTLSNLQYYYKDKDQLLVAAAGHFFKICEDQVSKGWAALKEDPSLSLEEFIREILNIVLAKPEDPDQLILFKEIRSLALRNKELEVALNQYYEDYGKWFVALWSSFSSQPEVIVSLLVPYIEGYSLVGKTLPVERTQLIELLTAIILQLK